MDRYAHAARRLLTRFRPEPLASLPSDRTRLVSSLERALSRRARAQKLRKQLLVLGSASAAAVVLLIGGLGAFRLLSPAAVAPNAGRAVASTPPIATATADKGLMVVDTNGVTPLSRAVIVGPGTASRPVINGMSLQTGMRLLAPPMNEVGIATSDGTVLTLEASSELTILEQGAARRYSLRRGALRAQVTKLAPGERFIVQTEDTQVEVHGTVFRVAMVADGQGCHGGVKTRVSVFDGVVSVRSGKAQTFVPAGGQWPEDCALPSVATASSGASGKARGLSARVRHVLSARHKARKAGLGRHLSSATMARPAEIQGALVDDAGEMESATPGPSSTLSAENDLFAEAVRARRQRQYARSLALFSKLIDTYPNGPLAESAMVQRMKVLHATESPDAVQAAHDYLRRFPAGFARATARRISGVAVEP